MKNYSSNRAQKGKTGYRTPSRWLAGKPEALKRTMHGPIKKKQASSFFRRKNG